MSAITWFRRWRAKRTLSQHEAIFGVPESDCPTCQKARAMLRSKG